MQQPFTSISDLSRDLGLGWQNKDPATPREALWIPTLRRGQRVTVLGFVGLRGHSFSVATVMRLTGQSVFQ